MAVVSIFFAMIIGIIIGILCAVFNGTWFDKISFFFSVLGMSLPSFFAAILFAWVFAFLLSDLTGLSMFGSLYTVDNYGSGLYIDWKNLILPALTLGIRPLAVVVELTKNSILDVLSQDYIRTAKAKGLSYRRILIHHSLKNALNPVVTVPRNMTLILVGNFKSDVALKTLNKIWCGKSKEVEMGQSINLRQNDISRSATP